MNNWDVLARKCKVINEKFEIAKTFIYLYLSYYVADLYYDILLISMQKGHQINGILKGR